MRHIGVHEAKTHLARLVEEVARGETITITKHGVPVAMLVPPRLRGAAVREVVGGLRAFRAAHPLGSVTIRELIDEGRR